MECQDMIHLIISKGVTRRDLARFQAISRTWAKCCREAIKSLDKSYLVGVGKSYGSQKCIQMFNLRTAEVHPLKLSRSLTSYLGDYWVRLLDSCEGLVLIFLQRKDNSGRLAVGNPCINQWKLLPNVMYIRHGTISRENDTLVITAMCRCGPLYEYNVKNDSWYCVTEKVGQTDYYYWWRGDYYSWFDGNPCIYDELRVKWVPLQDCRIKVSRWFTVESNGRFYIYVMAEDRLRTFEVVNKNVVEVVNKILSEFNVRMAGSGENLVWKRPLAKVVVGYSTLDNSPVSIDVTDSRFQSPVYYTDDGGVAFSRFMQRNWESKRVWPMKSEIGGLRSCLARCLYWPPKFVYMCTLVCGCAVLYLVSYI